MFTSPLLGQGPCPSQTRGRCWGPCTLRSRARGQLPVWPLRGGREDVASAGHGAGQVAAVPHTLICSCAAGSVCLRSRPGSGGGGSRKGLDTAGELRWAGSKSGRPRSRAPSHLRGPWPGLRPAERQPGSSSRARGWARHGASASDPPPRLSGPTGLSVQDASSCLWVSPLASSRSVNAVSLRHRLKGAATRPVLGEPLSPAPPARLLLQA